MEPLTADLKTRQQLRASGLSAGWLALAVVEPVAENAKEPAEHAVAMGDQTGDKEAWSAKRFVRDAREALTRKAGS